MARKSLYPPSVTPGIPKLEQVPEGWEAVPYGELIRKVKRPADLVGNVEYQLVNAKRSRGGIVQREKLRGKDIKVKTQFYTRTADFLISRRQIIHGACGLVPEELDGAIVSNEYDTMVTESDRLLIKYLDAFSHTTYFQKCCFHSSIGVDVEKMIFKLEQFLQLPMPLPPLPEQRKIVEILSSVDEAIQATEAVIEQTRRVKEGLLQELLTRGIGHTQFKKTKIGELPEDWEVRLLGELSEFVTSGSRGWGKYYSPSGSLFVRITNLSRKSIDLDLSEPKYVRLPEGLSEGKRTQLQEGDVLVSITADLGITSLVQGDLGDAYINQHIALVRLKPNSVMPAFVAYYLSSRYGQDQFGLRNDPGAKAGLNLPNVRSVKVPIPGLEEQKHIVSCLRACEQAASQNEKKLQSLVEIEAGLFQDLLAGNVRVSA